MRVLTFASLLALVFVTIAASTRDLTTQGAQVPLRAVFKDHTPDIVSSDKLDNEEKHEERFPHGPVHPSGLIICGNINLRDT